MQEKNNAKIAENYHHRSVKRIAIAHEILVRGKEDPEQWRVILTAFFFLHEREKRRVWVGNKFISDLNQLATAFECKVDPYIAISCLLRTKEELEEWGQICKNIVLPCPDSSWATKVRNVADRFDLHLKNSKEKNRLARMPILEAIELLSAA